MQMHPGWIMSADEEHPVPMGQPRGHYLLDLVPGFDRDAPRHYWVVAALFPVGAEDIAKCRRGEGFLLGQALRVSHIYCDYCGVAPDVAEGSALPCPGGGHA